jgi:hypothetical protein
VNKTRKKVPNIGSFNEKIEFREFPLSIYCESMEQSEIIKKDKENNSL